MSRIAIVGAGAWGTAISIVLGRKQRHQVCLWAYEEEVRRAIEKNRINDRFLPAYKIPEGVKVTGNLAEAVTDTEILVSAMPSQHCRPLFEQITSLIKQDIPVVSATKGLEQNTFLRMTEVIKFVSRSRHLGALSGPSFAAEVARGDPTAVTIASANLTLATTVQ